MSNLKVTRRLAACTLALALAACGTFRNDLAREVPADLRAVLVYRGPSAGVSVSEVDGQNRGIGLFDRFELAPGLRTVTVFLNLPGYRSDTLTLQFEATPGREYELKYEVSFGGTPYGRGTWRTWVVDSATGETVSRPVPRRPRS